VDDAALGHLRVTLYRSRNAGYTAPPAQIRT
jgi:hypothetical protein